MDRSRAARNGHRPRIGLVLGAGGILGAAWMVGALNALAEESGWDPSSADYIIGTSAGSVIGSLVAAGLPPWFLLHHQLGGPVDGTLRDAAVVGFAEADAESTAQRLFTRARGVPRLLLGSPLLALRSSLQPWRFPAATRAAGWLGRGFLSTQEIGDIVRRVVPTGWAEHPNLWITAVEYSSGRRVVFGREGAGETHLGLAVEASCAIPGVYRPVRIDGRLYVDGGIWSPSNLDLLANEDVDVVVAVNPMSSMNPGPPTTLLERVERKIRTASTRRLVLEASRLRRAGKHVLLIEPDEEDLGAMGVNLMNRRRRLAVLDTALTTTRRRLAEPDARKVLASLDGRRGA